MQGLQTLHNSNYRVLCAYQLLPTTNVIMKRGRMMYVYKYIYVCDIGTNVVLRYFVLPCTIVNWMQKIKCIYKNKYSKTDVNVSNRVELYLCVNTYTIAAYFCIVSLYCSLILINIYKRNAY